MAGQKSNTYTLDATTARTLRRPLIEYPFGVVPRAVIQKTVIDRGSGFTAKKYPALDGSMRIDALFKLIDMHFERAGRV